MTHTTLEIPSPILNRYLTPAVATAQMPLPGPAEDAAEQFEIALTSLRSQIEEIADADTAAAVTDAMRQQGHDAGAALLAVAGEDGSVDLWPSERRLDTAVAAGPLPALGGLLASSQAWVPHTVILVDRIGADVRVVRPAGVVKDHAIDGDELHITKSQPGGWSQRRFQRSAEEQWKDNADTIVDELTLHLEPGELVLLAGDETMRPLVRERLPERVDDTVVELEVGGRAADGSDELLEEAIDRAVRRAAMRRRTDAQSQVMDAIGRGAGVTGAADVAAALFEGRAETLLLHLTDTGGLTVHVGDEPQQVAADPARLTALDLTAREVPLADGLLRAAAAHGTQILIVQDAVDEIADGVAATLRS